MTKTFRILPDNEERWLVVICYNDFWCQDFYLPRDIYENEEAVLARLHKSSVINYGDLWMEDAVWKQVSLRHAAVTKREAELGLDISHKLIDMPDPNDCEPGGLE